MIKRFFHFFVFILISVSTTAQVRWVNVDSLFQPLPPSVHVYRTTDTLDGRANIAYYLEADLRNGNLEFTADTTSGRRLTPSAFYKKNGNPLVVVNCTFFSFETNQNLNLVIRNGEVVSRNLERANKRIGDSVRAVRIYRSAIGINRKGRADVAWTRTDSSKHFAEASQVPVTGNWQAWRTNRKTGRTEKLSSYAFSRWNMQTAVGGGPVLVQKGRILITNEEEIRFAGKAINDRHPRTAMGYTKDGKLLILVVEGRNPGVAEGATLPQLASIFTGLGAWEALNLDGGGSSCMIVNGKDTIRPSDKGGQRAVPAVFMIVNRE